MTDSPASQVPGPFTAACCQLDLVVGDREGNLARAQDAVRAAAAAGASLVVLPELMASGYVFLDALEARDLAEDARTGPTVRLLTALAAELDLVVVSGLCELDEDGVLRNSAVVVDGDGVLALYRKVHLWDAEKLVFTAGDAAPPVVDTALGRLAVMICYDLEFPEWVRLAALAGADVLCVPTNWPRGSWPAGERAGEVLRAQAAASTNHLWVVACDRAGLERGVDWVGGSAVIDPDGFPVTPVEVGEADEASVPRLVVGRVVPAASRTKTVSARNDVLADRRPELYGAVAQR